MLLKNLLLSSLIAMGIVGCTTLSHNPECSCDCKSNNSHFECGGISKYESAEIK